jgi:nascent polypeptide-associated complex subunit alpha
MSAAQQLAQGGGAGGVPGLDNSGIGGEGDDDDDDDMPDLEAPEEEGPVDETGVDPKDIDLVMAQVNCSRAKAVRVLKESGGDLINASMSTRSRLSVFSVI